MLSSPEFNPYREWLGIPPIERLTFYRLLGLKAFESNPKVINAAAQQRLAMLHAHESGPHAAWAQMLSNELTAARLCLLSPQHKSEYDEALRQYVAALERKHPGSAAAAANMAQGPLRPVLVPRPLPAASASSALGQIPLERDDLVPAELVEKEPSASWPLLLLAGLLVVVALSSQAWIVLSLWTGSADRPPVETEAEPTAVWSQAADEPLLEFAALDDARPYRPLALPEAAGDTEQPASEPPEARSLEISSQAGTPGEESSRTAWDDPDILRGHTAAVVAVAFTPDGRRIVSASLDGALRLWDLATRQSVAVLSGHEGAVRDVAVNRQGTLVLSGGDDRTARLWSLVSHREMQRYEPAPAGVRSAAFTADGDYLALGDDSGVIRFFRTTGEGLFRLGDRSPPVRAIRFFPDRRHVAFAQGNAVRLLRVGDKRRILALEGHRQPVSDIDLDPDGRWLVSCSWDRTICVWNVRNGRPLHKLTGHVNSVHAVAFSPNGHRFLSASGGHYSADDRFVEGIDNSVRLWDVSSGAELERLKGHEAPVLSVAFSPDGHFAASGSVDQTVRIWELGK